MNAETKTGAPPLAALVMSGDTQKEAEKINDFIFMVKDLSNVYVVKTNDGDLLVNSGFSDNAARTKGLVDGVRSGPLRYIILTQSHADHYGGVPELREAGTKIITERRFPETREFYMSLLPYAGARSRRLWGATIKRGAEAKNPEEVTPDILVDRKHTFEQGGRKFELLSTPGGETIDGLTVWMPNEKIAFTGNLFGPVFMSMPFLCTLRGDRPRSVLRYLKSLDIVRKLGAELLITGHGEPIRGAAKIKADLDMMYDSVSFVNEYTIAGMNAGKDVHTLMREIKLPDHLHIGEYHGKISWSVRSIWEEYSGWFHYDSTTALYGVPRSNIDGDLVELAGGAGALAKRAREKLNADKPVEAMHLVDIALGAAPTNIEVLKVKKDALQRLLVLSGGTNFSETMWLKVELGATEAKLASNA